MSVLPCFLLISPFLSRWRPSRSGCFVTGDSTYLLASLWFGSKFHHRSASIRRARTVFGFPPLFAARSAARGTSCGTPNNQNFILIDAPRRSNQQRLIVDPKRHRKRMPVLDGFYRS